MKEDAVKEGFDLKKFEADTATHKGLVFDYFQRVLLTLWVVIVPYINLQFVKLGIAKTGNLHDYQKIWDTVGGLATYFHRYLDPAIKKLSWLKCKECDMFGFRG